MKHPFAFCFFFVSKNLVRWSDEKTEGGAVKKRNKEAKFHSEGKRRRETTKLKIMGGYKM